jgi:hypothetical protein
VVVVNFGQQVGYGACHSERVDRIEAMLLFRLNGKGPPDWGCNDYCDDDSEKGAHKCLLCLLYESRSLSTVVSKLVARWSHHCAGHHKENGLQGNETIRAYKGAASSVSADVNLGNV